jgi:hypothetical protein
MSKRLVVQAWCLASIMSLCPGWLGCSFCKSKRNMNNKTNADAGGHCWTPRIVSSVRAWWAVGEGA